MRVDRSSPVPLHHQLREVLEGKIRGGEWAPHQMIPTELDLMQEHQVSRTTVRQALAALVVDGLLYRQQGKGTFVAQPRIAESLEDLLGFTEVLQKRGLRPKITVLRVQVEPAALEVQRYLGMSEGDQAVVIERRIDVDNVPLFWVRSYLPQRLGLTPTAEELAGQTLFHWLEVRGRRPDEAVQTMSARRASPVDAEILKVRTGSPVLVIGRAIYGEDGQPLEYTEVVYRSDRYEYQIRLQRSRR